MSYVKLDSAILQSSVWFDRDARDVFITALLLAFPMEIMEPMAEIGIATLEETGYVVPPGWYGFVEAAGPGLIRSACLDREVGNTALRRLTSPDPDSRSKEYDGRRLVRVQGGFIVLNYMKYREKDHTTAERSKRYRARKKGESSHRDYRDATRDGRGDTRDITEAEAEAEVQADHSGLNGHRDLVSTSSQGSADRARAPETALAVVNGSGWVVPHGNPHGRPTNLVNGAANRIHGKHAWCSHDRPSLCVLHEQHTELMGALQRPDGWVKEWYAKTLAKYDGVPIGDDRWTFWRNEVAATVGTVTSAPIQTRTKGNASVAAASRYLAQVANGGPR